MKNIKEKLNVNKFLGIGDFQLSNKDIEKIHKLRDAEFGMDIKMLYFYYRGYNIVFLSDNGVIKNQQIDIQDITKLKIKKLKKISIYQKLSISFFEKNIICTYADKCERVVVLKSKIILYYALLGNNHILSKIIQYDQNSINLAENILKKIFLNPNDI